MMHLWIAGALKPCGRPHIPICVGTQIMSRSNRQHLLKHQCAIAGQPVRGLVFNLAQLSVVPGYRSGCKQFLQKGI